MFQDVTNYVKNCQHCQAVKEDYTDPNTILGVIIANNPVDLMCVDFKKLVKKLVNLYSAYYNEAMPFLKCFTILTYNFPAQALSTVSFLCEREPPPPISTPWGAYRQQGCL